MFRQFKSLNLCVICLLLTQVATTYSYKPVIIIHGILDKAADLADLAFFINKTHPGTKVSVIDMYDREASLTNMWVQLEGFKKATENIMKSSNNGVHIIGFSQGGLLARGLIQTTNDHNVDNFISLSAPLNGQYGDTSYINEVFPASMKETLYLFLYTKYGQNISFGNYWKDPHHIDAYMEYSEFLAKLNNESSKPDFEFPDAWRKNFARLNNLVLIGGPDDGVISPWQSAQFGCYDVNETTVDMRNLKIYQNDIFGLRSLDKADKVHECTIPGVHHTHWHKNPTVFYKCIEQWLT